MVKRFTVILDGREYEVEYDGETVVVDGRSFVVQFPEEGAVLVDGHRYAVDLSGERAVVDGIAHALRVQGLEAQATSRAKDPAGGATAAAGAGAIQAIMPGKIVQVLVSEGQEVEADQVVCVLEAMKMQNELRAAAAGTVAEVRVRPGQSVTAGEVLVVIS